MRVPSTSSPTQLNAAASTIWSLLQNCKSPSHIHQIQAQLIVQNLHSNTHIAHSFISACQPFNLLHSSFLLFTQPLTNPHVFICNSLIRAFSHSQIPHVPIHVYSFMHKNCITPNSYTFPFVFKSLSDFREFRQGQCVHAHVVKFGFFDDVYVQNSLLSVYASCGYMDLCCNVFDEMRLRDVVTWTVLITGYKGVGKYENALVAFEQMQYAGVVPNRVTMVNALAACAGAGAVDMGVWIHDFIRRKGWELDVILGTALVDMYASCGRVEEGLRVFEEMKEKNVFTWNVLIKGFALANSGEEAIWWFSRMELEGIKADEVTLVQVLSACSHSGMVEEGREIFNMLVAGRYGFPPSAKHYACMIDLLARAGCLEEALSLIQQMPFQPTKAMWGSLLGCANAQRNLELSEFSAWKLVELEPGNSVYYVLLSNLYAEMGRWGDVEKVREMMKERGLQKDLGYSSVELEPQEYVYELLAK